MNLYVLGDIKWKTEHFMNVLLVRNCFELYSIPADFVKYRRTTAIIKIVHR